ncbi:phosphoglucosamine mutase [Prochlorococcus marinus]|uniref:phosphoglucosamine mutase n=1 Tax=Prochlorococcus marinus TaxID=1219 RepID=UPI0022B48E8A|nr:phosphoglucosamine mutase [Prochlorococcus marinus]
MTNNALHPVGRNQETGNEFLFGTDGIRGEARNLLKGNLIKEVGYCTHYVLPKKGPILIGQDSRESSGQIVSELSAGLMANGRDVFTIGLCPTPTIPHLIKSIDAAGGLMVSASHNPPKDNGIKIFDSNGEKISSDKQKFLEASLQKRIAFDETLTLGNAYSRNDLLKDYKESLLGTVRIDSLNKIPIVLDLCWGSATACGKEIFTALGAKVICINSQPNGRKINVNCGSTNLSDIKKAVQETNSQMGFAFDGDADRVIAIDKKGRVLDGDHILYLWGSNLQEKAILPKQRLVATMMSNLGFEKAWVKRGGVLERTAVGDKYVHETMLKTQASLGGEQSGHILTKINGLCGDGLLTALQLANMCNEKGIELSDWLDESFTPYPQRLINIPLAPHIKDSFTTKSESFQSIIKKAQLELGNEGRIFIRKSGTESLLRVMIESQDSQLVEEWAHKISKTASEEISKM